MTTGKRLLLRYGLALVAVGAACLLRQALTLWVGPGLPTYITFYPAVMFVALAAGIGPGIWATVTTAIVVDCWLLLPHGLGVDHPVDVTGLALFSGMGLFISVVAGLYRRMRSRLEELVTARTAALDQANVELRGEIDQRQRTQDSLKRLNAESEQRVAERTAELARANADLQSEIQERKQAQAEAQARANQQTVVAQLGQHALAGVGLDALLHETVQKVAQTLQADYCEVLELLAGGQELLLRAGVGCKEGRVGRATVGAGMESQAGYTLLSDEPVIVEDLRTEKRFRGSPLMLEHGVVSGVNVIVAGRDKPFGVLGVHTTLRRQFTRDDIHFLQAVANVVAAMIDREAAAETARRANAYNRSLIEASLDPLVTIGPDGKITDVNAATEAVTGRPREELIGTDFLDYFTEPEKARAGYQRVFREGLVRDYPLEIRHKDGRATHVLYHASVYRNEMGEVIGVFAAARDVTARRRAEEALRAERQRLYDLLETLPVYVVLLARDYHVPFANRFFRERFGESHGRRCFEYLFQRTEPCEDCQTYKVLEIGGPHRWEWTGPDGRDYDVYDFPFTDTDGSALILEMGMDVTDHKRAQHAVQRSEARYRSFVEASTQMGWTANAQGLVTDDLSAWREFTGQSREQVQGWGWLDALHPDDRQHTAAAWSRSVATQTNFSTEFRLRRHDGEFRWLSSRGVPVLAEGTIREWVGACTDITERKRADEEVQRLREELGHVDRAARLGELTASLAHELNQPLAAILSNAQAARRFLASGAPDMEQFREILDDIIQDDKRAGSVIHRLRLMLQKRRQEPENFNVNDPIREVVQLLHSEAVGRNAAVTMELASGLPAVWAGRVELQQVMMNLIINALDAVKDVPPDRRQILIRTSLNGDAIVVAVRDRGCGIPSAETKGIFEPFFTTKPTGLGMGLAICRRMIQAHGGRIWAENNEDGGATISFTLPLTQADKVSCDG